MPCALRFLDQLERTHASGRVPRLPCHAALLTAHPPVPHRTLSVLRLDIATPAAAARIPYAPRALQPENFLITDPGPDARIKLSDFGLSAFFREGEPMTDVVGSAYYMAPGGSPRAKRAAYCSPP